MAQSLKDKIRAAFAKLGGAAPEGDEIAHELLVAYEAATLAEARKKKAKKTAVAAGLITDVEQPVGSAVFSRTEHYTITAKTSTPRTMIDEAVLLAEMMKYVSATKAAEIITLARKTAKAPTTWIVEERQP